MTALHLAAKFGHTNVLIVLEDKVPWTSVSTKVIDQIMMQSFILFHNILYFCFSTGEF